MVATPKRTEIEGETLLQVIRESRASKPSGGWSEIACRACVKKRRLMPSAQPATNGSSNAHAQYACPMAGW